MTSQTARRQIREAALAALQTIDGLQIATPGMWDVQPTNMPAVRLRASSDLKLAQGKAPPIFKTTVALEVQLYVTLGTDSDAQDQAELLSDLIENALLADPGLIGLANSFPRCNSIIDIDIDGARPVVKVDMTLYVETTEMFAAQGPFMTLQELDIWLDAAGGPVDPTGVYSDPPPNDVATTPPRTWQDGPDGRAEGVIRLDMTTGLPPATTADYPARVRVIEDQAIFPDGSSLDNKRGWNWGRWDTTTQADADLAVAQGVGIIRIPVRFRGLYGALDAGSDADAYSPSAASTGGLDPAHLAIVDQQIQYCTERSIPFILFIDSNCGQNGTQSADDRLYCQMGDPDEDWPDGRNFMTDPAMFETYRTAWRYMARKYSANPMWAICEITPEPSWPVHDVDATLAYYRTLSADIRQCAPGVPFLVGPWQYKITDAKDAWDRTQTDFIYTGNLFVRENDPDPPAKTQSQLNFLLALRTKQRVPIFVQQLGMTSGADPAGRPWLRALLNAMLVGDGVRSVGGTYWELRDPTANNDPGGYGGIWTDRGTGLDVVKTEYMGYIAQWLAGNLV